jgi:hypothetical protein
VFCRKLVIVTGHGAECRIDLSCDMTKKCHKFGPDWHDFSGFRPISCIFALAAFSRANFGTQHCKIALSHPQKCRNFHYVTVTARLCQSAELIQRVTVTRVCRIDRNGTVVQYTQKKSLSKEARHTLYYQCHSQMHCLLDR